MAADRLSEYWDVYDRRLQRVGQQQRQDPVRPGCFHLVVDAFIFNPAGEVLLQQRSANKLNFPSCWDCSVGGSVVAGETITDAMHREMTEELGLDLPVSPADNYLLQPHSHWIEAWFAFQTDRQLADFTIQHEELQRVAYFDLATAHDHLNQIGFNAYTVELQRAWEHVHEPLKKRA
ncbi:MAG: NUDIX domain-containing protein [Levilactobacillus sp.]|uniref:NUDIX domain-containing protein n=1 Tax=Levilactobacillus suantsaiihabitans TaxID=2487722 RepID=A0A4Z0J5H4_9LACO|nr:MULTISPECIES: NUDIX domain-containing protein [Levilactobacillus]MCH4124154.1 NUDIX domain-containing protein [Levilactobacillus sp.]MCI1554561.1 NUDIX domain-containing protein [Levilactobacillus sp.]MCI1598402.1 NUDIX domain-containing protein [Levilactobacillus sp.]TGD17712.1 NUDIX domain-containing protein [Levilactobacillus suantsaiihabitans]